MTQVEYLRWVEFYTLYPFDDYHRFHRPAALIAGAMAGGDMQARLDWLQPQPVSGNYSEADMKTFKALGQRPPRG